MTNRLELYRCEICGNIVQVMHHGNGELVCCGKPMSLLVPHLKEEEKQEKHVPVFGNNEIYVGSVPHPMAEEHHIEFIESISSDMSDVQIKFLKISDEPKMVINADADFNRALEYCNLHGLWDNFKE